MSTKINAFDLYIDLLRPHFKPIHVAPKKSDITDYSDNELSLRFFNNEGFYLDMKESQSFDEIESLARDFYVFTNRQLTKLRREYYIKGRK